MPRIARMKIKGEPTVYHVMSRTALDGFVLGDVEKDFLLDLIKRLSRLYFAEIIGFCLMGNHFHLLCRMHLGSEYADKQIQERYKDFFKGEDDDRDRELTEGQIELFRVKWEDLSEFTKDIKQCFSRFYNKRHDRRGFFWAERFKSVIVDNGGTLINCLAYIDFNPVRAKMVEKPEEYRWSSIGYHVQRDNEDGFLSLDFGLKEFGGKIDTGSAGNDTGSAGNDTESAGGETINAESAGGETINAESVGDVSERLSHYRRFLYRKGGADRRTRLRQGFDAASSGQKGQIDGGIVETERERDFKLKEFDRFRYRTRYFTDSGIIGSKEYVNRIYQQFKHYFASKHEKLPKTIEGLEGVYSLKRLSEGRSTEVSTRTQIP